MKHLLTTLLLITGSYVQAQPSLILTKQRPPELDVTPYTQIAVGDIVGPMGTKTEQSLDLTDALTAKLFNAKTLEVIDRNAMEDILGSQRRKDLEIIDDQTKQALSKKLKGALLITGRLQSQKLEQKLVYTEQALQGCAKKYYWQVKGDVTVQLRILDVKTGRMIFTNSVSRPVDVSTAQDCNANAIAKLDLDQISRNTIRELGDEIAKLVVPYEVKNLLLFKDPGLFKSPFKDLKTAISYLQLNNADAGITILKNYTESDKVKDKNKDDAWYNYGLGLLYTGQYADSRKALQMSASLQTSNLAYVTALMKFIDEEEQVARKLEAQNLERQKLLQAAERSPAPNEAAANKPATKTPPKSKAKKA